MSSRALNILSRLDWPTLLTMVLLVVLGWLNIVSATAEADVAEVISPQYSEAIGRRSNEDGGGSSKNN